MKNYREVKIGPYSAYAIAVKYGYTGTEEQWVKEQEANRVASEQAAQRAEAAATRSENAAIRDTDPTLSVSGAAADAKVTGDKISELREDLDDLVLKTKRNPLQLFNVNKVTDGKLKNDGTVDI